MRTTTPTRRKTTHFTNSELWYDPELDKELISQSIAKQYHILPSEQENLHYSDWYRLVGGLMEDTPLGRIVLIRKETNKDIIKEYGSYEKKVRADWNSFRASKVTQQQREDTAAYFEKLFTSMFARG